MWRRYLQIVCVAIIFGDFVALCTLVVVYRFGEWHNHFINFAAACWFAFLELEGSSSHGFLSGLAVSVLTIIASVAVIRCLHGATAMKTRFWEDTIIALTTLIVLTILIYAPQFGWEVARTIYSEHNALAEKVAHLEGFAQRESQYKAQLSAAQANAKRWSDDYTRISRGETVPDRVMSKEDTDKLHGELVDYKNNSGDKKYSTVNVGPAFADDHESSTLADQLYSVFKDAHWRVTYEGTHSKELRAMLVPSPPNGIVIFTDDRQGQASWIVTFLSGIGLPAIISDKIPPRFSSTLICIGYKEVSKKQP
jgi:hypothetical protein